MAQLQPYQDPTGTMSAEAVDAKNIDLIMQEMNRGIDATTIQRRSIQPGQFRILAYQPNPFRLHAGSTLAAGSYATLVVNFFNNGLTALSGQTFLPVFYVDLFVDPNSTSTTAGIYASNSVYPDGSNITTALQNLTFAWYLRNATPGTSQDVVSYVLEIRNQDSAAHAYWVSIQLLLPADANLNNGNTAVYLP